MDCPLSKPEIGNNTWHVLHSTAAHYPDNPTATQRKHYQTFFETFPYVYPCRPCAKNFQELTRLNPPALESRSTLSIWLCQMHNQVNLLLNKPEFKCSIKELDIRWRKGPPECYEPPEIEADIIY